MENKQALAVTGIKQHELMLTSKAKNIEAWCTNGIKPEALIRFTLHDMARSEPLQRCTQASVYLGLLACAVTGLEPGAMKGEAYLIPRKRKIKDRDGGWVEIYEAQFMIGYKGFERMAERSGFPIESGHVREQDFFDYDEGTGAFIRHKKALRDRGEVTAAYAWTVMPGQTRPKIVIVGADDLAQIRAMGGDVWNTWPGEMSQKTAIKRLGKHLPLGDFRRGAALDDAANAGEPMTQLLDDMAPPGRQLASAEIADELAESVVFEAPPPAAKQANERALEIVTTPAPLPEKPKAQRQTQARPTTAAAPAPMSSPAPVSATPSVAPTKVTCEPARPTTPPTPASGAVSPAASAATPVVASPTSSDTEKSASTSSGSPSTTSAAAPSDELSFNPFDDDGAKAPAEFAYTREQALEWFDEWAKKTVGNKSPEVETQLMDHFMAWGSRCETTEQLQSGDAARFIQFMDANGYKRWDKPKGIQGDAIRALISKAFGELQNALAKAGK